MRTHGTLTKWNDDRGFGFIKPAEGTEEIFVHISAFPRDSGRPQVGQVITYETEIGDKGKLRAVSVLWPGGRKPLRNPSRGSQKSETRRAPVAMVACLLVMAGCAFGYSQYSKSVAPIPAANPSKTQASNESSLPARCDGRQHCSQMKSCAEAKYFIKHCPNTKMDGDNDGIPCEQDLCIFSL